METYPTGYGFTGEQTDANGQVYLRARYYDPGMGIFPSLDPFGGIMDRPMSINGYSWVRGNVINRSDPNGMQDVYPMAPTPDGGGVGSGLPFHPAYIAHLLEGLAIIGGGTVAAVSSTLLAHELYNWVRDNYFDRGISITSTSIRIGGQYRAGNPSPWHRSDGDFQLDKLPGELLRYSMAIISNREPVALEIRTNTRRAKEFFLEELPRFGFTINMDAFVRIFEFM